MRETSEFKSKIGHRKAWGYPIAWVARFKPKTEQPLDPTYLLIPFSIFCQHYLPLWVGTRKPCPNF